MYKNLLQEVKTYYTIRIQMCFTLPTSIDNIIRFKLLKNKILNIPIVVIIFTSNIFFDL